MRRNIDRALHGPSLTEIVLGAVLSVLLGIAVGAALLITRPVVRATELPKQPKPDVVYYIEGLRVGSAQDAMAKLRQLPNGRPVRLTEADLNALALSLKPPAAAANGQAGTFVLGTPNVRIRRGVMQVAVPVTVNVLGFAERVLVQARGGFAKEGTTYQFEPDELYFGSCPVQRIPFLATYVRNKVMASVPPPVATAWSKLTSVAVRGDALAVTM